MKLGHFGALCCFVIALLSAGFVYWDLQDGYFSVKLLSLPILTSVMGVALLLFPGGPTTFQEAARQRADGVGSWKYAVPPLHRRAWLVAAGIGIYLSFWASNYLEGKQFFTINQQVMLLLVMGILGFFLRKQLRQLW